MAQNIDSATRRQKLRALVDTATDPLVIFDPSGTIDTVNDAFVELSGFEKDALRDMPATSLFHPADLDTWESRKQLLVTDDTTDSVSWRGRLETATGSVVPVDWEFSTLLVQGETLGIVGRGRDLRESQRKEQELEILNRVLRHNVRNQMNVIMVKARLLQEIDDASVRTAGEQIEAVAEDVVDTSDKARRVQKYLDLPLDDQCRAEIVADTKDVIRTFEIEYPNVPIETDLPDYAMARAPPSFDVALAELLENAVVHHSSGNGPVSVTVDKGETDVCVTVADDCGPIPEHVRENIARGAEEQLQHNEGLGLWIVRWVVEPVDGDLSFRRRPDDSGNVVELAFDRIRSTDENGDAM